MKAKTMRRQYEKAVDKRLMHNYRQLWADLVALPRRTRARLAWLMWRGDAEIDKAAKRKGATNGKA